MPASAAIKRNQMVSTQRGNPVDKADLPENPDTHIPQLVLSMLCNVRGITTNPHDYECYEQAIEAVTKVRALARQRQVALEQLAQLGEEIETHHTGEASNA